MVNYSKGKIYKVEPVCEHEDGDIYIGSTAQDKLCMRWREHKKTVNDVRRRTSVCEFFNKYGMDKCHIVLLEQVDANCKEELRAREAYYVKTLKCVNKRIPNRTEQDWRNDNKEHMQNWAKEYN